MAIRSIPEEIRKQEMSKLQKEYEKQFGEVSEQEATVNYSKTELAHIYAQNLLFWSSRITTRSPRMMKDIARRAICENACMNIKKYLKEIEIENDVNIIIEHPAHHIPSKHVETQVSTRKCPRWGKRLGCSRLPKSNGAPFFRYPNQSRRIVGIVLRTMRKRHFYV
jgi:hypothetical protein